MFNTPELDHHETISTKPGVQCTFQTHKAAAFGVPVNLPCSVPTCTSNSRVLESHIPNGSTMPLSATETASAVILFCLSVTFDRLSNSIVSVAAETKAAPFRRAIPLYSTRNDNHHSSSIVTYDQRKQLCNPLLASTEDVPKSSQIICVYIYIIVNRVFRYGGQNRTNQEVYQIL